jgi:hypothetical protein
MSRHLRMCVCRLQSHVPLENYLGAEKTMNEKKKDTISYLVHIFVM